MKTSYRTLLSTALACLAPLALANDYPTADRVNYVLECMKTHPGSQYEMVAKCSCALDTLAKDAPHAQYSEMITATNANSIGGERGNTIRDTEVLQVKIRRYRELQAKAQKTCFLAPETK